MHGHIADSLIESINDSHSFDVKVTRTWHGLWDNCKGAWFYTVLLIDRFMFASPTQIGRRTDTDEGHAIYGILDEFGIHPDRCKVVRDYEVSK